jgi:hypothetical protein
MFYMGLKLGPSTEGKNPQIKDVREQDAVENI